MLRLLLVFGRRCLVSTLVILALFLTRSAGIGKHATHIPIGIRAVRGDSAAFGLTEPQVSRPLVMGPYARFATETTSEAEYLAIAFEILFYINYERGEVGLTSLPMIPELLSAAFEKAEQMATYNYFAHQSPVDGRRPNEFAMDHGYGSWKVSECIAGASSNAQTIVSAWMASGAHRAFLLFPDLRHAGVGSWYDPDSDYGWYISFMGGFDDDHEYEPAEIPPWLDLGQHEVFIQVDATTGEVTPGRIDVFNLGDQDLEWSAYSPDGLIVQPASGTNDGVVFVSLPPESPFPMKSSTGYQVQFEGQVGTIFRYQTVTATVLIVTDRTYLPLMAR